MSRKKSKSIAFTLVIEAKEARVRKGFAPATRVLDDVRRKKPKYRPNHLAETDDSRP